MRNLDKFRGCLLAGAAGDALGYEVEFMPEESIFNKHQHQQQPPQRETGEGTSVLVTISSEHRPNTWQQEEREVGTLRLTFLMSLPKVSL